MAGRFPLTAYAQPGATEPAHHLVPLFPANHACAAASAPSPSPVTFHTIGQMRVFEYLIFADQGAEPPDPPAPIRPHPDEIAIVGSVRKEREDLMPIVLALSHLIHRLSQLPTRHHPALRSSATLAHGSASGKPGAIVTRSRMPRLVRSSASQASAPTHSRYCRRAVMIRAGLAV